MAKKKSKLKSALKKIGKAAAVAGAGYLAMKGLGKRKQNADFLKTEGGDKSGPSVKSVKNRMTSDRAYTGGGYKDSITSGGKGNMYEDKYKGTPLRRIQNSPLRTDGLGDMDMKDGGRAKHKSGGSVKKSMGKALRGGGKVMR